MPHIFRDLLSFALVFLCFCKGLPLGVHCILNASKYWTLTWPTLLCLTGGTTNHPQRDFRNQSHDIDNQTMNDELEEDAVWDPCSNDLFILIILVMYVIVCAFGLIGNTLSFAVLHRSSKTNSSTYLLKVLALTDNAFLAMVIPSQIYQLALFCLKKYELFMAGTPFMKQIVHGLCLT